MKNKFSILSLFFATTILLVVLLQSAHSFHHLEKFIAEKHCNHKYNGNKTEINHGHNDFEHCFACEFTFSNTINSDFFVFSFKKTTALYSYSFFYSKEISQSFRGSLFALRAPPCFIV